MLLHCLSLKKYKKTNIPIEKSRQGQDNNIVKVSAYFAMFDDLQIYTHLSLSTFSIQLLNISLHLHTQIKALFLRLTRL